MNLSPEMFEPAAKSEQKYELVRESVSFGKDVWRRLKKDKLAMIGLCIVIFITLIAILAPVLTPYDYATQDLYNQNQLPSAEHYFGTDQFGRDVFTRVLYGARISMTVAYVSTVTTLVIGALYGGISGFIGGKVDLFMMRIVEILSGIPSMLYLILFMVKLGPGLHTIILSMSITGWLGMARMVRAQVIGLKNMEYVLAVRTLGVSETKILLRHLIPNSLGVIIVNLTLAVPSAIFNEAFLSFLGLGVSAPTASWGVLANEALSLYMLYPHQLLFPCLAICITIMAFNFLGDGLRDALDPKMRK
ncbi:MAG: ABC transporter permease [Lachnospiraceae bacterium]|nr:ABC transporter permease [Lachnospiraceae bacterium]